MINTVEKQVVAVFVQQLEKNDIEVTASWEHIGCDEFDLIECVMKVEDACGVVIEDAEVAQLQSVADLVQCVTSKK